MEEDYEDAVIPCLTSLLIFNNKIHANFDDDKITMENLSHFLSRVFDDENFDQDSLTNNSLLK